MYYRLDRNLTKQVDRILHDEVMELMRDIEDTGKTFKGVCEHFAEEVSHRKHYPIFFRVISAAGDIYFENFVGKRVALPPLNQTHDYFFTIATSKHSTPYRCYLKTIRDKEGEKYVIQIATPLKLYQKIIENYVENVITVIPIVLILSIGCGIFLSRKPHIIIKSLINTTHSIHSQNLKTRLSLPKHRDETWDLIVSINEMMDRLEQGFMEIKQFSTDVSHELRNSLFALKGEIEVALAQERSSEEYRKVLNSCVERINFLTKMVNDLFLLSRFEFKNVNLDVAELNLREIIEDLFDFFLPLAQDKYLQFTMGRIDSIFVNADKTRMHQLFSNLIENAIKFTPERGAVSISLIGENSSAQFTITDSGIGIPETEIPKVFNRFYQVDSSRSGFERGSGLGLNICKKIVEVYGGTIQVTNNKGRGVTFTVILPIA
jgi:heavy metal sensor kinase